MPSFRHAISRAYYENWMLRKYGGAFGQRLEQAQANTRLDPQEMEALRKKLLCDLLRQAQKSPYYRRIFKQLGAEPEELLVPAHYA